MKQHSVPENIMDVEFKLFGSLTAKQFGYIVAGAGIAIVFYLVFKTLDATFLGWIFAGLSAVLGLSLALIRINDQPFEVWLGNFLFAMFSSQKKVWRKSKKQPVHLDNKSIVSQVVRPHQTNQPENVAQQSAGSMNNMISANSGQTPRIPRHPFKDLSQGNVQSQSLANNQNNIGQNIASGNINAQVSASYIPGSAQGYVKITSNQTPNRPISIKNEGQSSAVNQQMSGISSKPNTASVGEDHGASFVPPSNISNIGNASITGTNVAQEASMSNLSQSQVGGVNRGVVFDQITPTKEENLQQIKANDTKVSVPVSNVLSEENEALRKQLASLSEENESLKREISNFRQKYSGLETQNIQMQAKLSELEKQIQQMKEMTKEADLRSYQVLDKSFLQGNQGTFTPKVYDGPSLTKKPNVVSGIVKTKDGRLLAGVTVIIKDPSKTPPRPIRAMTTNSLGQFITISEIEQKGTYIIEFSKDGYNFGRYEIEVTGNILPTYEFIAN